MALGLADVLIQQLGTLDVEKVRADLFVARDLGHLRGQRVGDCLGDQRLATTRGAVEQDALGGRELVLGEQRPMEIGQLHGIGDCFDLRIETAHICVGDVGNLFENQFFNFLAIESLDEKTSSGVVEQRVAGAHGDAPKRVSNLTDALIIGTAVNHGPIPSGQHLFEGHDFT